MVHFSQIRRRLPTTRKAYTHRVVIAGKYKVYIRLGLYPLACPWGYDPGLQPGEVFIDMEEAGSSLHGLADSWSIAISLLLQASYTAEELCGKFAYQKFPPAGMTDNPEIRTAHSIPDYVARWIFLLVRGVTWEEFTCR